MVHELSINKFDNFFRTFEPEMKSKLWTAIRIADSPFVECEKHLPKNFKLAYTIAKIYKLDSLAAIKKIGISDDRINIFVNALRMVTDPIATLK